MSQDIRCHIRSCDSVFVSKKIVLNSTCRRNQGQANAWSLTTAVQNGKLENVREMRANGLRIGEAV